MSNTSNDTEATETDAWQAVKSLKNKVYNAAVTTDEVADELGVDTETAYSLLEGSAGGYLETKPVGEDPGPEHHIWW